MDVLFNTFPQLVRHNSPRPGAAEIATPEKERYALLLQHKNSFEGDHNSKKIDNIDSIRVGMYACVGLI